MYVSYLKLNIKDNYQKQYRMTKPIQKISPPTNIMTLQAILGLGNYYHNYIPNMYELRVLLNYLLKRNVQWNWTNNFQKTFDDIKIY